MHPISVGLLRYFNLHEHKDRQRAKQASMASKAPSWADQWDRIVGKKESSNCNNGKKMTEVKAAASAGLEKAKSAASIGAQKVKIGTSVGIKWVKDQYQKKCSK